MAQVTRTALIVAHGQPSDPERPERELAARAARIEAMLPGWTVRSATLAASGALAAAIDALGETPVIYPMFMTDGWFVSTNLPRRLADAGAGDARILPPLGLDPKLPAMILSRLDRACREMDRAAKDMPLLLAAHGSPSNPRPRRVTEALAETIRRESGFAAVVTGYVDEAPYLRDAAAETRNGLCLPFFATSNSHVLEDLPEALEEGHYAGTVLPPVGEWDEIPALIAGALAETEPAEALR